MALRKEMKGKGQVPGKKHRRSWKRKLKKKEEKKVECLEAEIVKLKANVKRMKDEQRKAEEELEDKNLELAVIREVNRLVTAEGPSTQLWLDPMLLMLAEDGDLVAGAVHLFRCLRDLMA